MGFLLKALGYDISVVLEQPIMQSPFLATFYYDWKRCLGGQNEAGLAQL